MHNELRYQAKTHAISESNQEKNKIPHLLPKFIYFYFLLKTNKPKNNKDMLMEMEMISNPSM
jgi:hypothetical protein